ncbi:ATP-binding protein [Candidatus Woesearchaeota archaeon]|nr:ATP-binding protein [Candidatus Woesearchaeota archaeon]
MYEIVIGRTESDKKKLGLQGTIFLGKHYVKMGTTTSLSNKVLMDITNAHVALICGKRGSGKSYSLGTITEEMSNLPDEIKDRIAVLILDTMGIFWTMKYANEKDEDLLEEWQLSKKGLDAQVFIPKGFYQKWKEKGIPVDKEFTIKPNELNAFDWANTLNIEITSELGILLERTMEKLEEQNFDIEDIITTINNDTKVEEKTKLGLINRFNATKHWGLFDKDGTPLKEIIKGGQATILDLSPYTFTSGNWSIKNLVIGLVCKKLMIERMISRKEEELEDIQRGHSYFEAYRPKIKNEMPMPWILLDEAHEALPKDYKTPATDALIQLLREGRQPGISLILATQQPGEIHKDVMTQSDIVISHRVTARKDIEALNSMMQSYATGDIMSYLNALPRLKGSAIILDDNSEKIYPMRVRPKFSWHGGEAPTALKSKGKAYEELFK